ncbi:hypothetical protein OQA88_11971 [Cercophora sp. LCS_1]
MHFLSLLALAAPLASAIQFTSPAANSTLTKGDSYELTWSTVDTDPTSFSVYLVNFVNWPPSYTPLALDLETAAGAAEVKLPCGVDTSYGYQFNAINGTNVYVIYAQTPKFYISGPSCSDPEPTPEPICPSAAAAATVTVTVSTTLSSSSFINGTASITAGGRGPAVVTHVVTVSQGVCPDTIGWGPSGYGSPVTLSSVPHAPSSPKITAAPEKFETKGGFFASTSTVYSTVYLDMSEVVEGGCDRVC